MQAVFDQTLQKLVRRGKTIFISSHILSEVQSLCDIVSVIKEGNIIATGDIAQLLQEVPRRAILKKSNGYSLESLASTLDAKIEIDSNHKIIAYFNYSTKEFAKRISELESIDDFIIPEPNLEEYFLPLYQKKENQI